MWNFISDGITGQIQISCMDIATDLQKKKTIHTWMMLFMFMSYG